jgi:hypothetical protein
MGWRFETWLVSSRNRKGVYLYTEALIAVILVDERMLCMDLMYGSDSLLSANRHLCRISSLSSSLPTVIDKDLKKLKVDVGGKSEPTTAAMSKQKQKRKNKKSKRKARVVSNAAAVDVPSTSGFCFGQLPSLVWTFLVYIMGFILFWRKFGMYCHRYCP